MHTGRCWCKMDTCSTVATQSSCRSFVTQSCMSAGVVLLYLPFLLVWCLTISCACWCSASLKAILSGVLFLVEPNYQPCQLVGCLIIGHAFWCGASLSAIPLGVVPHYRTCLLVWCLTIGHAFWSGASLSFMPAGVLSHYRPCLLKCLIISHVFWCDDHYMLCLLVW